jgi:hypothetical protein
VASSRVGALALGAVNFLFVPPLATPPRLPVTPVAKIPDAENAWQEYHIALRKLGSEGSERLPLDTAEALGRYAAGETASLEPRFRAIVDQNGEALEHLLAGARRPAAQFTAEPLSPRTPIPSLYGTRGLVALAAARARDLVDAGHAYEAATLLLAAYRMACDLAEPRGSLMGHLISVSCRTIVHDAILYWAAMERRDESGLRLVQGLAELDTRVPDPAQAFDVEWEATMRAIEELLLDNARAWNAPELLQYFPGLRARAYTRFAEAYPKILERLRPGIERWDVRGVHAIQSEETERLASWRSWLRPDEAIAAPVLALTVQPTVVAALRAFYEARAQNAAVRALLVSAIYRRNHGACPPSLDVACAELGVDVPRDVMTGRAVGYRVDGSTPVVWLAGIDGRDDGGRVAYHRDDDETGLGLDGTDLIFRLGDPPAR